MMARVSFAADTAQQSARRGTVFLLLVTAVAIAALNGPQSTPADALAPQKLSTPLRIDPNTAGADDLQLLPGIGPKLAAAIIDFRENSDRKPPFERADDLAKVKRIGPLTVERLRPFLSFPAAPETGESP